MRPVGKAVLVLVRHSPLNGDRDAEALRMAVGLEIYDNRVTVAFLDAGVFAAVPCDPAMVGAEPFARHVEALAMLGHNLWAEAESLARYGLAVGALLPGVAAVPRERVLAAMLECDAVLSL